MKNDYVLNTPFVSLSDYHVNWEQGLLGLAIDPDFQKNHYIYLYYTSINNKTGQPINKIVRFIESNDKSSESKVILDNIPASPEGIHSGGAMVFGKDGKLYITVGDAGEPVWAIQQNTSSLLGKVLRINKDGTIPADNPYPNSPVYNIGHRNMYGIAFDNSGFGIVTENGGSLFDEINSVKEGNYGYRIYQPPDKSPELSSSSIKPLRNYWKIIAPTQAIYYQGNIKELNGKFLFGSDMGGTIYALQLDNSSKSVIEEDTIQLKHYPYSPVISIAESPSGDLYYGGYEIYKLEKVDSNNKKPTSFFIEMTSPYNITIDDIEVKPIQNKMIISINPYSINNNVLFSPFILSLKIPKDLINQVSSVSAIYDQTEKPLDFKISKNEKSINVDILNKFLDSKLPQVNITKSFNKTKTSSSNVSRILVINGTAFDMDSGIQKIEGFVHTFPFNNKFSFIPAIPISNGNWSKWSIPLNITTPGYNRILIQATDYAGNQNWDEITIFVPSVPFTLDKLIFGIKRPSTDIVTRLPNSIELGTHTGTKS